MRSPAAFSVVACGALCLSYGNLFGQSVPVNGSIPGLTLTSGSVVCQASSALTTTSSFAVNGSGTAIFQAGTSITLQPGFDASAGTAAATFDAKIVSLPIAPALAVTPQTLPGGAQGLPYTAAFAASGGCGAAVVWTIVGTLPSGLTFNTSTGSISGTPAASGTSSFTITAQDGIGTVSAPQAFSIAIAQALSVTSTSLSGGAVGTAYSQALAATGGTAPYSWSVSNGTSLPPGLALSTAGIVSGTPTTAGSFAFTAVVTGSGSAPQTASASVTLTIAPKLTISTSATLPQGVVSSPYSQGLAAAGGTPSYVWSVATGSSLPSGMTLSAGGTLNWPSPVTGSYSFSVTATDSGSPSQAVSQSFSLAVVNEFTVTATPASVSVALGQTARLSLSITPVGGYTGPVTITGAGSSGITFSPLTVNLSGGAATASATIAAGPGSQTGALSVGGAGAASAASVAVTVTAQPAPVISLSSPAAGTCCWGVVDLRGYALENTPALPSDKISAVNVSISANDDSGYTVADHATYGDGQPSGVCGSAGAYPGGTDCPNVQFDYLWKTGTTVTNNALSYLPNGTYTVTMTALDSSQPALSSSPSASVVLNVDNQAPSPVIVSPVNGSGLAQAAQVFTILYTSPHSNLDFGNGEVAFTGTGSNPPVCVVTWTLAGSIGLQSANAAPSPCKFDATNSSVTNNGANEVTVKISISFPSSMAGPILVQANGSNAEGETLPLSTLTSYTVLSSAVPSGFPAPFPTTAAVSLGGTVTVSQTMIAPTGTTPSFAGASGSCYASNIQLQPTGSLSTSTTTAANGQVLIQVSGSFTTNNPYNESVNGSLACTVEFVVFAGAWQAQGTSNVSVIQPGLQVTSAAPILSVAVSLAQSGAGSSASNLSVTSGSEITLIPGISGTIFGGNLSLSVTDPSLPPATYALQLKYPQPSATQYSTAFITVTPVSVPAISIGPISPVSIAAGRGSTFSVDVSPVNGYAGTVSLAQVTNANTSSMTLSFAPSTLNLAQGPATTTATVSATAATPAASYTVPFSVSDQGTPAAFSPQSGSVAVSVQGGPAASYTSAVSPASVGISLGHTASTNLVLTPTAGFSASLTASISSVSSGLSVSFSGTGAQTQTLTLSSGINQSLPIVVTAGLPISATGCAGCSFTVRLTGVNSTTGANLTEQDITVSVPVGPPGALLASVLVSGLQDPVTGFYPIGIPIYFSRPASDNSVGAESFTWTTNTIPPGGWALPASLPATMGYLVFSPTASGVYCAQYTVTDGLGRTASSAPFPQGGCASVTAGLGATITGPTVTTAGQTITLTAHPSGGSGNYSYSWANATGNSATATFSSTNAGANTVALTLTDTSTSNFVTIPVKITVYPQLSVTITGALPTTAGQSLLLTATGTGGSGSGYTYSGWSGAAASSTNPNMATFTASAPGNQIVGVTVTDGAGNTASTTTTITVSGSSSLGVSLTLPGSAATSSAVTLAAQGINGSGNYSYQWSAGSSTGSGSTFTYTTPSSTGSVPVMVTVTDTTANKTSTNSGLLRVLPGCSGLPSHEYVWLGGQVVAVEIPACAVQ